MLVLLQIKKPDSDLQVPDFEALAEIGGMAPQTIRDAFKQMLPYFRKVFSPGGQLVERMCLFITQFVGCYEAHSTSFRAPAISP